MDQYAAAKDTDEYRKWASRGFQVVGLTDVALGIAVAVFGPGLVGGEPAVDATLMIAGGVLASGGVAFWWWGRYRYGARTSKNHPDPAVEIGR